MSKSQLVFSQSDIDRMLEMPHSQLIKTLHKLRKSQLEKLLKQAGYAAPQSFRRLVTEIMGDEDE